MQIKANKIAEIIGAQTTAAATGSVIIRTLLTDSRDLIFADTTMFFALRTAGNDGHNYIPELYKAGVRHFVVDNVADDYKKYDDAMMMVVDDVLDALQRLARYVRSQFDIPVIGITGSRGKTIVKEQITKLLSGVGYNVTRSPRSYNSQIGVPLSVWELDAATDIGVFEAGISTVGEMSRLEGIIRPDVGVFTTLTDEHDQGFASLDEKALEKARLFAGCPVVYVRLGGHSDIISRAIKDVNPRCEIRYVEGDNHALSLAVARAMAARVADADLRLTELSGRVPRSISPRINVTQTLKNCLIVHDGYTFDTRSLIDALNFATRHVTPGRTLTLIVPYLPDTSSDFVDILVKKGVKRLITVERPADIQDDRITTRYIDCHAGTRDLSISDFANEVILVKGEAGSVIEQVKSVLEAPRHETVLEVDLGAIIRNYNFFRSKVRPTTGIIAMVKAAGYGVGAFEPAKALQNQGAAYLAVAVIDEGIELRQSGITMPIIVMNPIGTNYNALFDNKIEPSVFSLHELDLLLDNAVRLGRTNYPVHIKLDTGMHRLGFTEGELPELIERLNNQTALKVASIFSHLATADCLDQDEYTKSQLDNFDVMSNTLIEALPYRVRRHVLNTAGILRYPEYQYDMVRLGIGLYGVSPIDGYRLETVASLVTTIISIKQWDAGITIGYGRKGKVNGKSVIATIPIGYADGLNRHLSNGGASVLVNGHMCPIIGNICMDQCMIDVTGADAKLGDTVEVFGPDAPIERLAEQLQTIPYEILTSVSGRVKRIYFRE